MVEDWIQWKPIEGLVDKYYTDSIIDQIDNFKICLISLDSKKNSVEILFKYGVDVYAKAEESFRVKLIQDLNKKYGIHFYSDWTLFKVNNSRYISWISEQSYQWSNIHEFIHFSLITSNAVVDIIANYEPIVKILKNES